MQKQVGQPALKQDAGVEGGDGCRQRRARRQKSYASESATRLSSAWRCCRDCLI
jgi:hypothetical protein